MSSIAKIFIFINFILSIAYMVIAGTLLAQKWDYKKMLIDRETDYQQAQIQNQEKQKDLEAKIESLEATLKNANERAIEFKLSLETTKKEYDNAQRLNNTLTERIGSLEASYKEINDKIGEKDARISELEAARDRAKEEKEDALRAKDSSEEQQLELQIEMNNIKGEVAEKEKILQKQQRELLEAKQILTSLTKRGINIEELRTKEELIDGFITAVSNSLPLVMISVGSDDKVQKGYQFTVYRGSKYIGTVVVEEVYKDASAARISADKTVQKIQKGDSITTRFGGR